MMKFRAENVEFYREAGSDPVPQVLRVLHSIPALPPFFRRSPDPGSRMASGFCCCSCNGATIAEGHAGHTKKMDFPALDDLRWVFASLPMSLETLTGNRKCII
jgi:hypothetical protein